MHESLLHHELKRGLKSVIFIYFFFAIFEITKKNVFFYSKKTSHFALRHKKLSRQRTFFLVLAHSAIYYVFINCEFTQFYIDLWNI